MAARPEVTVDGVALSTLTESWGDLEVVHKWPGGCWSASFAAPTKRYRRIDLLRAGAVIRVLQAGACVWLGTLDEPDEDSGRMVASGLVRQGEQVLCLAADGTLTTISNTAVNQAIARGVLDWYNPGISATAFSDPTKSSAPIYLNDLLESSTAAANTGYGVGRRGDLYVTGPPDGASDPTVVITPETGEMGIAESAYAGSLQVRYISSSDSTNGTVYANVRVGAERPEVGVSLAGLGVISSARANLIATSLLAKLQEQRGWTNGLEVSAEEVTNYHGGTIDLAHIRADGYSTMRLDGVRDETGTRRLWTQVQIGETRWRPADAKPLLINPVGLEPRDLPSIAADYGAEFLPGY